MNKEQRSLTWKYFWKRKREELWEMKGIILLTQLMCTFLLAFILFIISCGEGKLSLISYLILYILLFECMIFVIGFIIYLFIGWLRSNWKLATQDAVKELKRRKKDDGKNRS